MPRTGEGIILKRILFLMGSCGLGLFWLRVHFSGRWGSRRRFKNGEKIKFSIKDVKSFFRK